MKKSLKTLAISTLVLTGMFSTLGLSAPVAKAADNTNVSAKYELPHVTQIETGDFYYEIDKPIGFQTLSGISPLMLINPDGIIRDSKVKVTMSDGSVLLQYGDDNAYYVNADQVKLYTLRK